MADKSLPGWAERLSELRRARAWTASDLAIELKKQRDGLPSVRSLAHMIAMDWETGKHRPGPRYRLLLASVYGTEERDIFADAVELRPAELPSTYSGLPVADPGRPVAPELADYFRAQLAGHYQADRFLGPMRLIPVAIPQYGLICDLASEASGVLRSELWSLATGFAALLGWLHEDAGNLRMATAWLDVMLERAHRSQDVQLVGFALHSKAMVSADLGDGLGVLDLTGSALQQRARLCPKVQVLVLQQAAHGTSLAGGDNAVDECDQLLDDAADMASVIDDEYAWGGFTRSPRYVDVQRATVMTRLGRTRRALELWDTIIADIPSSESRDLGVFKARQAQALADAGEPEQAVVVAREVAPVAVRTASARMRAELLTLKQRMKPWDRERPGRALNELLSGFGDSRGGSDGTT